MTREEAIQILSTRDAHGVLCGYTSGVTEALDMAIEALRQTEWTPVSGERLPENTEQVLITVLWHKPYDNYEVTLGEYWHDSEGWGDWKDAEIVAWKPLPEPYKKDGEEE